MRSRYCCAIVALLCGAASAQAAPDLRGFVPSNQISVLQPQADKLAQSIAQIIRSAEDSAKSLSSTDKETAIQLAVQNAIIVSGYDPRVVLAALQAFASCPTTIGLYSVTQLPVSCAGLKDSLSPEAREALANLEKVVVALLDQNDEPGALGVGGTAPLGAQLGIGPGGRGYNGFGAGGTGSSGADGTTASLDPPLDVGGGGSSDYIAN